MSDLVAYHNDPAIKGTILAELAAHREADRLVQNYGYWEDGKGCAVGCTIQSGDHMEYERRFGIPVALARLEDAIFEGLPVEDARAWPERFMRAIKPGADLSRAHWHLLHWLLTDESVNPGIRHPIVQDAVRAVADMMSVLKDGGEVDASAESAESAARAARAAWEGSAAWSAAWSAESAASAARAAWEESAEWGAERIAASVARSAASVARADRAAWVRIADKLIAFIEAAPMAEPSHD